MMRFGLSQDALVRASPHNAVTYLWAGGYNSLNAVNLTSSGSALVVPEDATLLMMGFTDELDAELATTAADRFTCPAVGDSDGWRLVKMAARKRTAEPGTVVPSVVTVIALQGAAADFGDEWNSFGIALPPLTMQALRGELPGFRQLKTV